MTDPNTSSVRTRAAAVCIACHQRKVKCDLESKLNNSCSSCERRKQICRPRRSALRGQKSFQTPPGDLPDPDSDFSARLEDIGDTLDQQLTASSSAERAAQSTSTASGFIGEQSLMVGPGSQPAPAVNPVRLCLADINARLLKTCGALNPPNKIFLEAAKDSYVTHIRYRIPVLDRIDLESGPSSILLQQVICLVHMILRHPRSSIAPGASEEHYAKVKTLLSTNYETDTMVNLKAMCLLHCWNMVPPDVVSTDSSWALTGMALRYAFHMGLHKESTYWKLSYPKTARRIAWYLFTQDRIQTLCWNRPPMGSSSFFDLAPPQLEDFEVEDVYAHFFISFVKLLKIMEKVTDFENNVESASAHEKTFEIMQSFVDWIQQIPPELMLYNSEQRRPFVKCMYELHILYFCGLILLCHHFGRFLGPHAASIISLTASTFAARLYEELDYRDQVTYLLSIHNWCLMVACVPQIGFRNTPNDEGQGCAHDLQILTAVLKQMTEKWPSAHRILDLVQRAWHPTPIGGNEDLTSPQQSYAGELGEAIFGPSANILPSFHARDLFPFPPDAIPRLEALERCEFGAQAGSSQQMVFDNNLTWFYDELSFYNFDTAGS